MKFAVHRPGYPIASPRSHGVPRRDVHGRIHISVARVSARSAYEARLALTRLRIHVPAGRASLAGERWPDLLDSSGRLILKPPHQQTPSRPQDLTVEAGLRAYAATWLLNGPSCRARHVPNLQVFDPDQVELPGKVSAGLFNPVLTAISFPGAQPCDGQLHPGAAPGSAFSLGELALQLTQALVLTRGQAGNCEQFAVRQSRRHRHAPVNAHSLAIPGGGNRIRDHRESNMPAACAVHRYPAGFRSCRHWPGPAESHLSCLRDPNLADAAIYPAHLFGVESNHPEPLIPAGLAPRRTLSWIARIEERSPGVGEVPQCLLLNDARSRGKPGVLRPRLAELPTLLQEAWRTLPARVPMRMLFDSQVPDISGVRAVIPQHRLLGRCWKQPVTRHTNTLSTSSDISEEVERRPCHGLHTVRLRLNRHARG